MNEKIRAIILAAGKGKRLNSEKHSLPKVMREVRSQPLISYVLKSLSFIPPKDTVIVVGYMKETVTSAFPEYRFAEQDRQLGTGHAVNAAAPLFQKYDGAVLVCCGDMPLVRASTYKNLINAHLETGADCTILSGVVRGGRLPYGRIVRGGDGGFLKIVEEKDATDEEKQIRELNAGIYVFNARKLFETLPKLKNNNAQEEYYLTDAPRELLLDGGKVQVHIEATAAEMFGVNTAEDLLEVESILKFNSAEL